MLLASALAVTRPLLAEERALHAPAGASVNLLDATESKCPFDCDNTGSCRLPPRALPRPNCAAWTVLNKDNIYLKMSKSGSTTVWQALAARHYGLKPLFGGANLELPTADESVREQTLGKPRCAFTFVREPVERFISGYRELIARITEGAPGSNLTSDRSWPFWGVANEPERFRQFVDDMTEHEMAMTCVGHISHVASQVDYIGRFAPLAPRALSNVSFFWAPIDQDNEGSVCGGKCLRKKMFAAMRTRCGEDFSAVLDGNSNPASDKVTVTHGVPVDEADARRFLIDEATGAKLDRLLHLDQHCFGYASGSA